MEKTLNSVEIAQALTNLANENARLRRELEAAAQVQAVAYGTIRRLQESCRCAEAVAQDWKDRVTFLEVRIRYFIDELKLSKKWNLPFKVIISCLHSITDKDHAGGILAPSRGCGCYRCERYFSRSEEAFVAEGEDVDLEEFYSHELDIYSPDHSNLN